MTGDLRLLFTAAKAATDKYLAAVRASEAAGEVASRAASDAQIAGLEVDAAVLALLKASNYADAVVADGRAWKCERLLGKYWKLSPASVCDLAAGGAP